MSLEDAAGAETLATMRIAANYAAWQLESVRRFLGKRICEVGSGIGNISEVLYRTNPEYLLLTDTDERYLAELASRFDADPHVEVRPLTLPAENVNGIQELRLDTIVAFNVIEHVERDYEAVASLSEMLACGGNVILLIPAAPAAFGSLDEALGHFRRYDRKAATRLLAGAGLRVESVRYFNLLGLLGWWAASRIRRRNRLSTRQIKLFDRLVPALRLERLVGPPIGLSLIAVGKRVRP